MPSLKAVRKRIGSVKNTQKITKAMKMVAAAKLRKAQQAITELRPYALKTLAVLSSVAARAGDEDVHPLLAHREPKTVMIVVLTSDRGLAGAFNTNVNKTAFQLVRKLEGEGATVSVAVIGRKARDYFTRRNVPIRQVFTGVFDKLSSLKAGEIARVLIDEYVHSEIKNGEHVRGEQKLDAIYLVYNEFKSAISQKVTAERLLPIEPMVMPEGEGGDFLYEPSKAALLERLLPMYVEVEMFRALLESVASEHGARMTAMDNATRNASELVSRLTLVYNRARQAAITKELMEIIGGAEALKG